MDEDMTKEGKDGKSGQAKKIAHGAPADREFSPQALRALAEAQARRQGGFYDGNLPAETGGRNGPEPVRYGDWEKDGLAVDF
jgi:hypothetical protein